MVTVKASAEWDVTLGALSHTFWAPPPSIPPAPDRFVPSLEFPAPQHWTGWASGTANHTENVKASGELIVRDGHDQGQMLLDITYPPLNMWLPLCWPFSTRQIMFGASREIMNGEPAGLHWIIFPMITCADPIKLPTALPIGSYLRHGTELGVVWSDVGKGFAKIAQIVAVDVLFAAVGGDLKAKNFSKGISKGAKKFRKKSVGEVFSADGLLGKNITREAAERASKKAGKVPGFKSWGRNVVKKTPLNKANKGLKKLDDKLLSKLDAPIKKIDNVLSKPARKKIGKHAKNLKKRIEAEDLAIKEMDTIAKKLDDDLTDMIARKSDVDDALKKIDLDSADPKTWKKELDLRMESKELGDNIKRKTDEIGELTKKRSGLKQKRLQHEADLKDYSKKLSDDVDTAKSGNVADQVTGKRKYKTDADGNLQLSRSGRAKLDNAGEASGYGPAVLKSLAGKFGLTPTILAKNMINSACGFNGYFGGDKFSYLTIGGGPLPTITMTHQTDDHGNAVNRLEGSAYGDAQTLHWFG